MQHTERSLHFHLSLTYTECIETVVSTAVLATLLVLWVTASTVTIIILRKSKHKLKGEVDLQLENREQTRVSENKQETQSDNVMKIRANVSYTATVLKEQCDD